MLFVVFGLFNGFLVKNVLASNDYVDSVHFYKAIDYSITHNIILTFHVKTTFYWIGRVCQYSSGQGVCGVRQDIATAGDFTAGNTYSFPFNLGIYWAYLPLNWTHDDIGQTYFVIPNFDDGWRGLEDNPYPFLSITYPANNDEIVNIFDITGTFTQPSGDTSHFLQADIMPTGIEVSSFQKFWTAIGDNTSGNFSITIGNIPAGYYDFRIYFISGAFDHYQGALISNIHIVNDLPSFTPPWAEQPPSTAPPIFEPIATSTFSTSTGLYTQLTDTFAPVLLSIVGNLQQFSSNFSQTNASSTGTQIGQSILLVRSYLSNINSFFSNFPVSQFLLLYLIALVVVIVLRLIKGLINLFKL